jgi:hypothetical protein
LAEKLEADQLQEFYTINITIQAAAETIQKLTVIVPEPDHRHQPGTQQNQETIPTSFDPLYQADKCALQRHLSWLGITPWRFLFHKNKN